MRKRQAAPVAPEGLAIPDYVIATLGKRQETILDHGFSEEQLNIAWWNDVLNSEMPGEFQISVDPTGIGSTTLRRRDLFELAKSLSQGSEDAEYLNFLWHVIVWGSGRSTRNNRQRIEAFVGDARSERVELLRESTSVARTGLDNSALEAYRKLIRAGGGVIPSLGPAFFTKFLYFVGRGTENYRCLILDARVASSLHAAGWNTLPHRGTDFSFNWYSVTYDSYCGLLGRWANEVSGNLNILVFPDEIERALFEGPQWSRSRQP